MINSFEERPKRLIGNFKKVYGPDVKVDRSEFCSGCSISFAITEFRFDINDDFLKPGSGKLVYHRYCVEKGRAKLAKERKKT